MKNEKSTSGVCFSYTPEETQPIRKIKHRQFLQDFPVVYEAVPQINDFFFVENDRAV